MSNNFKVDVQDYLSIKYTTYKEKLLQLALTNPTNYYQLREIVMEKVVNDAIGNLYESLYNVMTTGTLRDGVTKASAGATANAQFTPNYPKQEVGDFCLRAATTMEGIVRECVDKILPPNIIEVAKSRIASKTSTNSIDI